MREADHAPLRLAPPEHGQVPARPLLDPGRAGIVVLLEPEQAEVARMRRREPRDLDVVAHQVVGRRERVDLALEELLLGVPARPPREHAADVEVLAHDVSPHVLGLDALGRALVVAAAGRVDVVVARVPAHLRQVDPPSQREDLAMDPALGHLDRPAGHEVLRPAGDLDVVSARRQGDRLAVAAVDLGMEEEIRREAAAGRGINSPHPVADDERGGRRLPVLVADPEHHRHARFGLEQHIHVAAEAQVLRPLADVEADLRLPLAGIPAVDLDDPVLQAEPREGLHHRPVVVHRQVHPALDDLKRPDRRLRVRTPGRTVDRRAARWGSRRQAGRSRRPRCGP